MDSEENNYFAFGNFLLDKQSHKLLRGDEEIVLAQKCFAILLFLIENRERVVSKEDLLTRFWDESYVEESNLTQHIYRIRKTLKDDDGPEDAFIKTVPKFGYQFTADVEVRDKSGRPIHEHVEEPREDPFPEPALRSRATTGSPATRMLQAAAVGMVALLSIAGIYFYRETSQTANVSTIQSMAILPFKQIGFETEDDKLGLGMADTLIGKLSDQRKISISPTTTIIRFLEKGDNDPLGIGKALGVDAVLTGTLQRENGTIRVNVQIVDVRAGVPVWSEQFDSSFSDIFSLQDEVSEQIAHRLSLDINPSGDTLWKVSETGNLEAFKAYANGLYYWSKRTPEELSKAVGHFHDAIEKDPSFAKAHALLGDTYALIAYNNYDLMPRDVALDRGRQLTERALELDPASSEATATQGLIKTYENKLDAAETLLKKALTLNPNNATAYLRLAWVYALEGDLHKTIAEMKTAHKIDPQSEFTNRSLALYLMLAQKPDETLAFSQRLLEIVPPSSELNVFFAEIYEQKGQYENAVRELETVLDKEPDNAVALLVLSRIYAKTNQAEKARRILYERLSEKARNERKYPTALIHLQLGEKQAALALIKSDQINPVYLLILKNDYNLTPLRNTIEFSQFLSETQIRLNRG